MTERTLTARGVARRAELLDFATRMFASNGFHGTSVAQLVDGLGVGKGVFYWYFQSKEDMQDTSTSQDRQVLRPDRWRAVQPSATDAGQ